MSFLNPFYLWGLLLALPLVTVYLLKVKPTRIPTNTLFLWEKLLEGEQSNNLFLKLRNILSLILMLLVICCICLGLSEPIFGQRDNRDVIILIDQSASMRAKIDGVSSIERAKKEARTIVNALAAGQRASIATVDHSVHFLSHLSSNTQGLHQLIDSIEPTHLPENSMSESVIEQMLKYGESTFVEKSEEQELGNHRVVYISDGCHGYTFDQSLKLEKVVVAQNQKRKNIGIVAADIQPQIGSRDASLMLQFTNASDEPETIEVEFYSQKSRSIEELVQITVLPGKNKPMFFDIQDAARGLWSVRFEYADAIEIDNKVEMMLHPLPAVEVSIPDTNYYFFQRCVEAFSKTSGSLKLVKQSGGIHICEGKIPDGVSGDCIVFAPSGESDFWRNGENLAEVYVPIVHFSNHPMMKHFDVNLFSFAGAKTITAPEGAKVIVASESGVPLVYQVNKPDKSVVVVNLDPKLDDFFLDTSFVVLVYDIIMHLSGNTLRQPAVYAMGQAYRAKEKESFNQPEVEDMLFLEEGQSFLPKTVGSYKSLDSIAQHFSVGLLSERESALKPTSEDSIVKFASSTYPLSFWLIVLGITLLIVESISYHRRKVD